MPNAGDSSVRFHRDKLWRNWARTQSCTPAVTYYPQTLNDLVEIVLLARRAGHHVRAVGRGHSMGPLSVTDGSLVVTDGLNRIGPIDTRRCEVTIESGVTIGALDRALRRTGLAVPTNVVLTSVQYGGVIATGCHGAGWDRPTLFDLVEAMTVVTHDGTVVRFSEATHGPEVMNSVRCCLGTIGLVYDITLRVEPLSHQVAVDRRLPMATAEDPAQLASLLSGNEYTEVFWFPTSEGLWFKSWNSTSDPVSRVRLARAPLTLAPRTLASTLIGNTAGRHAMQRLPGMTPVVNKLLYRGIVPRNRTMVVDLNEAAHYRRFIELMKVQILSFSVKIDPGFTNVTRAWRLVVNKVRERAAKAGEYPLNLMLEMRPIRSSKVLLSPAFGQDDEHHCYFELISFTGTPGTAEFFNEVALAWMDIPELSARPHWAKYFFDIPGIIPYIREAWGENLTAFAMIRDHLDPDRVFMNPALTRIFYDED